MSLSALALITVGVWLTFSLAMVLAWFVEKWTGNSSWIDVIWAGAMGAIGLAITLAPWSDISNLSRQFIVAALITIWSIRLTTHLAVRSARVLNDPRYERLIEKWGDAASSNMFWLLQAQALLSVPMLFSVMLAAKNPAPLFTFAADWFALVLFAIALLGSSIADAQLTRFKKNVRSDSRICDVGLWAWSRHPNYFFEWLIWLAFALLAIDLTGGNWPTGYAALIGPLCMYWLLRYVSGVPPLEDHMLAKYGSDYAHYQTTTSVFFPVPPKRFATAS